KFCKWLKPEQDMFKLNTNGAVSDDQCGTGGTIRDCEGNVTMCFSGSGGIKSVLFQELKAILQGLYDCQSINILKVEVASDSLRSIKILLGFLGAALGSVGGVGGGGIFVPMLTLIIGFDPKSSTAISKCMIMGAAGSTVYYNLRLRHPTLNLPIIDYDLALLFQPMLMLGISIGVVFNVIFPDWMVTVLLIILFLGTSIKALLKGIETWKKETIMKETTKVLGSESKPTDYGRDYKPLPSGPAPLLDEEVPIIKNIYWKELAMLVFVWVAFLVVQEVKVSYIVLLNIDSVLNICADLCRDLLHPVLDSELLTGVVGGLLGLGGGFILGPLFLELGIPPQVASATSTFAMSFSSSMSVVQYYLLKRFPVPYAAYFVLVATIAAFVGQHVVRKLILLLGRVSLIIFILSLTIFASAISLGGVGIADMIEKLEQKQYMGFESLCHHNMQWVNLTGN
ncbi:hypothetical protein IFM89_011077, partial [Coptis chinensis]